MNVDVGTRKYLTALFETGMFGAMLVMFGLPVDVAGGLMVLMSVLGGFLYLGPHAMAAGFRGHLGQHVWLSDNGAGRWKCPELESHRVTFVNPKGMLVHRYARVWLAHPTPWSHLDIVSCEMCKQEGIKRWPEGAVHPTISPGELVIKHHLHNEQPRPEPKIYNTDML